MNNSHAMMLCFGRLTNWMSNNKRHATQIIIKNLKTFYNTEANPMANFIEVLCALNIVARQHL